MNAGELVFLGDVIKYVLLTFIFLLWPLKSNAPCDCFLLA